MGQISGHLYIMGRSMDHIEDFPSFAGGNIYQNTSQALDLGTYREALLT